MFESVSSVRWGARTQNVWYTFQFTVESQSYGLGFVHLTVYLAGCVVIRFAINEDICCYKFFTSNRIMTFTWYGRYVEWQSTISTETLLVRLVFCHHFLVDTLGLGEFEGFMWNKLCVQWYVKLSSCYGLEGPSRRCFRQESPEIFEYLVHLWSSNKIHPVETDCNYCTTVLCIIKVVSVRTLLNFERHDKHGF